MTKRRSPAVPAEVDTLASAARGGRVAHTGFLEPADGDALAAALRRRGVCVVLNGGIIAARRRLVIAFPEHVPTPGVALQGVYVAGVDDPEVLRAAARAAGVAATELGDAVRHQQGVSLITLVPAAEPLLALRAIAGREVAPLAVPLARLDAGSERRTQVVVPSLRVDVLGARAFRVSRSYFAKGMAAGRVIVNGRRADKGATADEGDEVFADGLGRFRVVRVEGRTRRGNLRVMLQAERG